MESETNRRSFLSFAIFGLGAIFSAILGVPLVCYFIDPRNRSGPKSSMKLVEGIKLDEVPINDPRQGVVLDTRTDGWTLYPSDVLGRVWVVKVAERVATDFANKEAVIAFNRDARKKNAYLQVFTTICPHLGCAVNSAGAAGFACPCHAATFLPDGKRAAATNPAKRGMDTLDWEIDEDDSEFSRIRVTYKKYKALDEKKIPLGGGDEETANI